jgi:hypothetical protein
MLVFPLAADIVDTHTHHGLFDVLTGHSRPAPPWNKAHLGPRFVHRYMHCSQSCIERCKARLPVPSQLAYKRQEYEIVIGRLAADAHE